MSRDESLTEQYSEQGSDASEAARPPRSPEKRWRMWLLIAGAAILCIALVWRFSLEKNGMEGQLITALREHGYILLAEDLYPAAAYQSASIRSLLPDTALEDAVAASKQAGFPSDINREGQIVL